MSVHYLETAFIPANGKSASRTIHLSPRQIEVLMLLGEGLANKPIGRKLGISACTVKQHVQAILKEFQATNRLQAVVFAYRYGILTNGVDAPMPVTVPMAKPDAHAPLVSGV
jgi:DNA-binding NarL/FixJ family response regulator